MNPLPDNNARADRTEEEVRKSPRTLEAFTLLEVMIAMGIFFMAIFVILDLTSQNITAAARLQRTEIDIASLAGQLSLTNRLEEGTESGDFGDLYPGARWARNITEVSTNGLFQVEFVVQSPPIRRGGAPVENRLNILMFRPESTQAGGRR
jgi:hypothetical protein